MIRFVNTYLDPSEKMSELLFGLIMTLTFTLGAGLVIKEGPDATTELLLGVLGCNLAWGLIDGLLYIFNSMFGRGMINRASKQFKKSGHEQLNSRIQSYLQETFGEAITSGTRETISRDILSHLASAKPAPVRMTRDDLAGAAASFLLVALTAAPAILPFLVIDDRMLALRVSNILMVSLIYLIGCQWAATIDANQRKVGLYMALGSLVIVQLTILLGG